MSGPVDHELDSGRHADAAGGIGLFALVGVLAIAVLLPMVHAQAVTSTGSTGAAVMLEVRVGVAPSLRAGISADVLAFDLASLGSDDAVMRCVLRSDSDPVAISFTEGEAPLSGRHDRGASDWPDFEVVGGRPLANYPPPLADGDGGVLRYQAFVLDLHANTDVWALVVDRQDRAGGWLPAIFVTAVCFASEAPPMRELATERPTTLASGRASDGCASMLVVVAVGVDGVPAGTSITDLQYTLMAVDAQFPTE